MNSYHPRNSKIPSTVSILKTRSVVDMKRTIFSEDAYRGNPSHLEKMAEKLKDLFAFAGKRVDNGHGWTFNGEKDDVIPSNYFLRTVPNVYVDTARVSNTQKPFEFIDISNFWPGASRFHGLFVGHVKGPYYPKGFVSFRWLTENYPDMVNQMKAFHGMSEMTPSAMYEAVILLLPENVAPKDVLKIVYESSLQYYKDIADEAVKSYHHDKSVSPEDFVSNTLDKHYNAYCLYETILEVDESIGNRFSQFNHHHAAIEDFAAYAMTLGKEAQPLPKSLITFMQDFSNDSIGADLLGYVLERTYFSRLGAEELGIRPGSQGDSLEDIKNIGRCVSSDGRYVDVQGIQPKHCPFPLCDTKLFTVTPAEGVDTKHDTYLAAFGVFEHCVRVLLEVTDYYVNHQLNEMHHDLDLKRHSNYELFVKSYQAHAATVKTQFKNHFVSLGKPLSA